AIAPLIAGLVESLGMERVRAALPVLRELRAELEQED
ncbi:MAG TPA: MarR family transcriptional regulator, partial [Paracoccus sp.]|nr:MarR family transcriptional regulator [Paracoccus sp. (in: a-proteobacteria)]